MCYICLNEGLNVSRKPFDDGFNVYLYNALATVLFYFSLPRWGFLERSIMERSGFTAKDNPALFYWLYEKNLQVSMMLLSGIFVILILNWSKRHSRYTLKKTIGMTILIIYMIAVSTFITKCYVIGGRWWFLYPFGSVALNDASAYFAGKCFGKH
mgnify:CR=1 FL=1